MKTLFKITGLKIYATHQQHPAPCINCWNITQPAITCSKLTIETLEQGVKYVQS